MLSHVMSYKTDYGGVLVLWLVKIIVWFVACALWCGMYAVLFYVAYRLFLVIKRWKEDHDEKK